MKCLVAIKQVPDHHIRVRPTPDGRGIATAGLKMSLNPFDENALEAALQLREAGHVRHIVAVGLGPESIQDSLRQALAMGADRALRVEAPERLDALAVARLLQDVVQRERPQLVLLGKQAIDSDAGQAAAMLAALLDWPQALAVSALRCEAGRLQVECEVDGGQTQLSLPLPAVLSADLRLNDPRFVRLPDLMKAKKKSIESVPHALAPDALRPRLQLEAAAEPGARPAGVRVGSVAELLAHLRQTTELLA